MSRSASSRRRRGRSSLFLLALSIGLALAAVGTASAGAASTPGARFVYETCDSSLPGGNPPAAEGGAIVNPWSAYQNCAAPGGTVGIVETAHAEATFAFLMVRVPAPPGGWVEKEAIVAATAGEGPGSVGSDVFEQGFPGVNTESSRTILLGTEQTEYLSSYGGTFSILASCSGNYAPGCEPGAVVGARDIAATVVDPTPPTVAGVSGSLLAGGVIRGHDQSLSATASDVGGGLSKVWVSVNGSPAAEAVPLCAVGKVANPSASGTVALSPTPCPAKLTENWVLNTEVAPFHTGANSVAVCASDFATIGTPNTICSPPQEITVDNTCTESPVLGGAQLSAQFKKGESDKVTLPFNGGTDLRGSLTTAEGAPVAGATLCVQESILNSFHRVRARGAVTTDAKGHYVYEVHGGPSREILVGYRHDAAQINQSLDYLSRARPKITASRHKLHNGERVGLTGTVPGPNKAERVVVLQASAPGSERWLTIRKAITDKSGEWVSGYRFDHTTIPTTYLFRALLPAQANYPYEEGASRPVKVRVKPGHGSNHHRGHSNGRTLGGNHHRRHRRPNHAEPQARRNPPARLCRTARRVPPAATRRLCRR